MAGLYKVPYRISLVNGFEVGTVMRIRGVVPKNADRTVYLGSLQPSKNLGVPGQSKALTYSKTSSLSLKQLWKHSLFYINLLCSDEPDSEIVLHFNPRLDESSVVFNTMECSAWGSEERGGSPAFQRGEPFELHLIAKKESFKVRLCHRGGRQHPGLFPWQGQ
ncbi:hypothetical protein EI555_001324, partial [Monodon monoceros]